MLRASDYQTISITWQERVAVLTLNRPQRRNAVDDAMHSELATVFRQARRTPDVDVLVLTGAGETFCPGGDTDPDRPYESRTGLTRSRKRPRSCIRSSSWSSR